MPTEPTIKRALAFFDGQNLFYAAKEAFGYPFPNYDPRLLTEMVCAAHSWQIAGIHFYTGIPSAGDKPFWNSFCCAFPVSPTVARTRGINATDWIRIDRPTYDACIDPHDYRPKKDSA